MSKLDKELKNHLITPFVFSLLVVFIFVLYLPGSSGPFMLDDWGTLLPLFQNLKFDGFLYSVFTGAAGPTGRPVSLLTFAVQHGSQDNPAAFKLVNILIHIFNTLLIAILTKKLLEITNIVENKNRAVFIGVVAFIWAILPIQISSILYVVQRMVLLSAFFTLLGLLSYLYCRDIVLEKPSVKAYIYLSVSVGLMGTLAILSKENGFLLVLYIVVLEYFIKDYRKLDTKNFRRWKLIYLGFPISIFILFIIITFEGQTHSYQSRAFTMGERLLTEPRVLWSYIHQILLPQPAKLSLFHQDYPLSKGLISPPSTLTAIFSWIAILVISFKIKKKIPLLLFGLLWFLAGHSMESTLLNLEIYFEHRNYLPSYSIILSLVYMFYLLYINTNKNHVKAMYLILSVAYVSILLFVTFEQTKLWGNELQYSLVQALEHPRSIRARSLKVDAYIDNGMLDEALNEFKKLQIDFPDPTLRLKRMDLTCLDEKFPVVPLLEFKDSLANTTQVATIVSMLNNITTLKTDGKCLKVPNKYIQDIILTILDYPIYEDHHETLMINLARLELHNENLANAVSYLQQIKNRRFGSAYLLAQLLASLGRHKEALEELETAQKSINFGPKYFRHTNLANELKTTIMNEINTNNLR